MLTIVIQLAAARYPMGLIGKEKESGGPRASRERTPSAASSKTQARIGDDHLATANRAQPVVVVGGIEV